MTAPVSADDLLARARLAQREGRLGDALAAARDASTLAPERVDIWNSRATLHYHAGQFRAAADCFRTALHLAPTQTHLFHDLGVVLKRDGRFAEAEAFLREATRRAPDQPASPFALANLLWRIARIAEAEPIYRDLIARFPDNLDVLADLAQMLRDTGRGAEAVPLVEAFVAKNGRSVEALTQLSVCYELGGRLDEALDITRECLERAPPQGLDFRLASYVSIAGRAARLDHRARAGELVAALLPKSLPAQSPGRAFHTDVNALRRYAFLFPYYGIEDAALMRCIAAASRMVAAQTPPLPTPALPAPARPVDPAGRKLRVGYVSYNFCEHPIGHLLSPFFEAHGASGTDLYLYALHVNSYDPNGYAARIRRTTPHYRDVRGRSAADIAAQVRADGIDILIDLDGYLGGGKPEVFAMRAAPVQIHWIQHLAGMPAPFIDYTIVDRVLVRDGERDNGNGPLIRLHDAFQCGDRVPLPAGQPSRAAVGLPDKGTVYCAFGNWLKIDGEVFDAWLEILAAVEGSVLWLSHDGKPGSGDDLRARLASAGLDPARLIFAPRLDDKAGHLYRHRAADLFLDTFTFSAATTTTDALWAGLPVLTRPGPTGQSRLAESLLRATGFTETIVPDRATYVAAAVRLGRDPAAVAALKARLTALLPQAPLYDAGRFVRQFRAIYETVWARHRAGGAPSHIDIRL